MSGIEQELLEVKQRKTFDAFTNMIEGYELHPYQAVSVLMWLYAKVGLFLFDPGMGKTITISAGLQALFDTDRDTKVLFLIKKAQVTQTAADVRAYTGKRVVTCTAEQEQIGTRLLRNPDSYDVLMLTHEALQSLQVCGVLTKIVDRFTVLVVDEGHYLTNLDETDRVYFLAALCKRIPYGAWLTATPFISKQQQLANLLAVMDEGIFGRRDLISKKLRDKQRIDLEYPLNIYNYDRKSEGMENTYVSQVHWVPAHEHQRQAGGSHYLRQTRGAGAENQVMELVRILRHKKAEHKRGLVYIYYKETLEWVLPFLKDAGFVFDCINGDVTQRERDRVQSEFNQGLLDFAVISVSTSINLDCEYVFFYEYTLEFKQILGRAERGLNPKMIELHFIFTKDTQDAIHFLNTVYKLSANVRSWIGKEYTEFLEINTDEEVCSAGLLNFGGGA